MANFLLLIQTIVFLELFRLFPILQQASMSLDFTSIPILVNTEIIFPSHQLPSNKSRIPDTSILFLLLYCSSLFWLISREVTLLSKLLTFSLKAYSWLADFWWSHPLHLIVPLLVHQIMTIILFLNLWYLPCCNASSSTRSITASTKSFTSCSVWVWRQQQNF